jgi:hypothetical protein
MVEAIAVLPDCTLHLLSSHLNPPAPPSQPSSGTSQTAFASVQQIGALAGAALLLKEAGQAGHSSHVTQRGLIATSACHAGCQQANALIRHCSHTLLDGLGCHLFLAFSAGHMVHAPRPAGGVIHVGRVC